jgi:CRP-like cAMP-binding protein
VAALNVAALLQAAGVDTSVDTYQRGDTIFRQGDPNDSVRYIESGGVKLQVTAVTGREAVIGLLRPGEFFGEGGLAGQPYRSGSATAIARSAIVRVSTGAMIGALRQQLGMSDRFIAHVLARNIRMEEELLDHLFHSCEQRLARTLIRLARPDDTDRSVGIVPPLSQDTLAEMIGTTRSRVNFFLNKFKKLGYIHYGRGVPLTVNRALHDAVER